MIPAAAAFFMEVRDRSARVLRFRRTLKVHWGDQDSPGALRCGMPRSPVVALARETSRIKNHSCVHRVIVYAGSNNGATT